MKIASDFALLWDMPDYVIGDVHGCYSTLRRLLDLIQYSPTCDRIWMTGDLVNGGPDSAAVVRWAKENAAGVVLGNHDLHCLAVASGARFPRKKDTFSDLLEASDRAQLLDWLRTRPLVIREEDWLLVHAGLLPEWSVEKALELAAEVEERLRIEPPVGEFLRDMYGNEPRRWSDSLEGIDRLRVIVNAMTRMRMLTPDPAIDFDYPGPPETAPEGLRPWFAVDENGVWETRIFFGHWAALGFRCSDGAIGLDSGCAWGGELTAWRLEDGEAFQVRSELPRASFSNG